MKTNQEMFDEVIEHLAEQGAASFDAANGSCAYRGEHNRKCAFGIFIPDALYSEDFEGRAASSIMITLRSTFKNWDAELADALQAAHDHAGVDDGGKFCKVWSDTGIASMLANVAVCFKLNTEVLNKRWPKPVTETQQ